MRLLRRTSVGITSARRRVERAYRRLGPKGVLRAAWLQVATTGSRRRTARWERQFDDRWGVDTAGIVRLTSLDIVSENREHGVRYQATDPNYFHELLSTVDRDLSEFVFVDFGSGKGRALILAAEQGFRRIIGVEFSPDLNAVAERNVRRLPAALNGDGRIRLLTMDATEFELPDEPLVIYFFNPFGDEVLSAVLERIRASVRAHPRPVFLLFTGPLSALPAQRRELRQLGSVREAGVVYEVVET